jgi:uncharacterized membrane protein
MRSLLLSILLCVSTQVALAQESEQTQSLEAKIISITPISCVHSNECLLLGLEGTTGNFKGQAIDVTVEADTLQQYHQSSYAVGQKVILETQKINGEQKFIIVDRVRKGGLLILALLFCAAIAVIGGVQSLRALGGLILSIGLLFFVLLPRILAGDPPLLVAFMGALVIMGLTFLVTHGWNIKMWSAFLGTAVSLLLTVLLGLAFSAWTHLFGTADEHTVFLLSSFPDLNTQGILLAGIIIGALGTLDDVTIAQASAVMELKDANPRLTAKELYTRSLRIGRDHIAGAINTLILAYAGASLPLLLLLSANAGSEPLTILLSRETFATEIIRALVGSLGLLAAIPCTSFFASKLVSR